MTSLPLAMINRTLQILRKAEQEHYGVVSHACYDASMAIGLVRAAERARSPVILALLPVTLAYGKGPFLRFCLDVAHEASVPVSVHLDHASDPAHLRLALDLAENGIAFDSIMVDASHAKTNEENIAIVKPYVDRAHKNNIAVEVELGRLTGSEVGIPGMVEAKLTNTAEADKFMRGSGADILAPCIGNKHGPYESRPQFHQSILKELRTTFQGTVPLCLHGTNELPDDLFVECINNGISKVNMNYCNREVYTKSLAKNLTSKPIDQAIESSTEDFANAVSRFYTLFRSAGKV